MYCTNSVAHSYLVLPIAAEDAIDQTDSQGDKQTENKRTNKQVTQVRLFSSHGKKKKKKKKSKPNSDHARLNTVGGVVNKMEINL